MLFYYWTGSRNRPYRSQKMYGMAKDFKPKAGQITLSSIIGRGILHELECANEGVLTIPTVQAPCQIALILSPWFQAPAAQNTPYCAV